MQHNFYLSTIPLKGNFSHFISLNTFLTRGGRELIGMENKKDIEKQFSYFITVRKKNTLCISSDIDNISTYVIYAMVLMLSMHPCIR